MHFIYSSEKFWQAGLVHYLYFTEEGSVVLRGKVTFGEASTQILIFCCQFAL